MTKAKKRATRRRQIILPMKLSSLIKIALKDLGKAEAQPKKFIVEMSEWYIPEEVVCATESGVEVDRYEACTVCAAGSVMAFTLNAAKTQPNNFYLSKCQPMKSSFWQ